MHQDSEGFPQAQQEHTASERGIFIWQVGMRDYVLGLIFNRLIVNDFRVKKKGVEDVHAVVTVKGDNVSDALNYFGVLKCAGLYHKPCCDVSYFIKGRAHGQGSHSAKSWR